MKSSLIVRPVPKEISRGVFAWRAVSSTLVMTGAAGTAVTTVSAAAFGLAPLSLQVNQNFTTARGTTVRESLDLEFFPAFGA
jgi:hypothetical protein